MAKVFQDPRSPLVAGKRPWKIDYVSMSGKRRRMGTTATTKAEAEAILRSKLSEMAKAEIAGMQSVDGLKPITFKQFVETEFLPHHKAARRPSTYRGYESLARGVMPTFGPMLLRSITAGDVRRYIDRRLSSTTRKGTPPASATCNRALVFIGAVLHEALVRGYVERNPIGNGILKKLPEDNARDRWLTDRDEERLLAFAPEWLHPLILVGIHTGIRLGRILSMTWVDVDRDHGMIRVPHAKNHKTRCVPMNPVVRDVLDSIAPFVGQEGPSPFVFVNSDTGKRYRESSVGHTFRKAVKKAGLETEGANKVTFHTTRHTFTSRLRQAGVSADDVRRMLGHSSYQMTDRYTHLAPDHLRNATDVLAKRRFAGQSVTNPAQRREAK